MVSHFYFRYFFKTGHGQWIRLLSYKLFVTSTIADYPLCSVEYNLSMVSKENIEYNIYHKTTQQNRFSIKSY